MYFFKNHQKNHTKEPINTAIEDTHTAFYLTLIWFCEAGVWKIGNISIKVLFITSESAEHSCDLYMLLPLP